MKIKRLMAGLLCGAVGAATLGLSGCGNAADSGMMDAANANAVAGGSSDLPLSLIHILRLLSARRMRSSRVTASMSLSSTG